MWCAEPRQIFTGRAKPRSRTRSRCSSIQEGIFKQDLATIEGEIKLARSDRQRTEDRLDWAQRMFLKGFVSKATVASEELDLKKARFALEQAESKKKVLIEFIKEKTIKELKSEIEKARSDELSEEANMGAGETQGVCCSSARFASREQPALRPNRTDSFLAHGDPRWIVKPGETQDWGDVYVKTDAP